MKRSFLDPALKQINEKTPLLATRHRRPALMIHTENFRQGLNN
nr:hypothetical protein [Escherichia coli]